MKLSKKLSFVTILLCGALLFAAGCGGNRNYEEDVKFYDRDYSELNTASKKEKACEYKFDFLPQIDGDEQGYVGDTMPFYDNGTYYVYYLKDRGDSYNHSIYLASTTDFVHWTEQQEPVLEADRGGGQEDMLGTGSVVKAGDKYYFFYTGHGEHVEEHWETIRVAEGATPTSFTKKEGWEILPGNCSNRDFRDPQAYYDAATEQITLTVTTQVSGQACIATYTMGKDLSNPTFGQVIHNKDTSVITRSDAYNLECSDTFQFGDKWYLTFSAQNDVIWYTTADSQYGPYTATPRPLEGHLFYAAKHVSNGTDTYMVGWVRRAGTPSDTTADGHLKGWGGNMVVQKVVSDGAGGIRLAPVDAYTQKTEERVLIAGSKVEVKSGDYTEAFRCFERYMVTGKVSGNGTFGFAFDYNGKQAKYKLITLSPAEDAISFSLNEGENLVTSVSASLDDGKAYSFTYIQEGSVGTLYVEGQNALTVRLYGSNGNNVMLFAKGGTATFSDLKQYTYTY